jgi:hypothetical protein
MCSDKKPFGLKDHLKSCGVIYFKRKDEEENLLIVALFVKQEKKENYF